MPEITAEDLKARLDAGDDFKLVAVLSDWGFEAKHIPGSLRASSMDEARGHLTPGDDVVVYCSDVDCAASKVAIRYLEAVGFERVTHFVGGLTGWEDAGYALEGSMVG